jgi:uncharacterized protein (TIRG00374 family)
LLWIILFIAALLLRVYRWKLLISSSYSVSFKHLYDSLNIGNLATMILPLRAGELIRPLLYSKWTKISFGRTFASVVIERVFDVCAMFAVFAFAIRFVSEIPEIVLLGAKILSLIALSIGFFMFISYFFPSYILSIISFFSNLGKRLLSSHELINSLEKSIVEFIDGLSGIDSLVQFLAISILSVLIWILYVAGFQVLLISFNEIIDTVSIGHSFNVAAVTCVFVSLFIAAPSAPGFIGTFQLGCVAALTGIFAYSEEFSIAFSIVAHSMQFIFTIIVGILSMFFQGLKLSNLKLKSI